MGLSESHEADVFEIVDLTFRHLIEQAPPAEAEIFERFLAFVTRGRAKIAAREVCGWEMQPVARFTFVIAVGSLFDSEICADPKQLAQAFGTLSQAMRNQEDEFLGELEKDWPKVLHLLARPVSSELVQQVQQLRESWQS